MQDELKEITDSIKEQLLVNSLTVKNAHLVAEKLLDKSRESAIALMRELQSQANKKL